MYDIHCIESAITDYMNAVHTEDCRDYGVTVDPGTAIAESVRSAMISVQAMKPDDWFELKYTNPALEAAVLDSKLKYQLELDMEEAGGEPDEATLTAKLDALSVEERETLCTRSASPYQREDAVVVICHPYLTRSYQGEMNSPTH